MESVYKVRNLHFFLSRTNCSSIDQHNCCIRSIDRAVAVDIGCIHLFLCQCGSSACADQSRSDQDLRRIGSVDDLIPVDIAEGQDPLERIALSSAKVCAVEP